MYVEQVNYALCGAYKLQLSNKKYRRSHGNRVAREESWNVIPLHIFSLFNARNTDMILPDDRNSDAKAHTDTTVSIFLETRSWLR